MADRQTRNISLPTRQDAFVDAMVEGGHFRTASELCREGIRLVEKAHHRSLLEKWLYEGLSKDEEQQLPEGLKNSARAHFRGLIDKAMQDVENGRITDGSTAMQRIRDQLEARPD